MKDRPPKVLPYIILVSRARLITFLEPLPLFFYLDFVVFVLNPKIPTKNSPNFFFVICWFDDVLLILIHGFAWFRVDLASPQVSPPSIHKISSNLPRKSPHFRPKIRPREEIPSSLTCLDHPDLLSDHPDPSRIS